MNDSLTIYEIEVLLHFYSGGGQIDKTSQAFKDAIEKFKRAGMLSGTVFKDEPLNLYIDEIRKVKLPVQVWMIPPTELEL